MNILILTSDRQIYARYIIGQLIKKGHNITGIVSSGKVFKRKSLAGSLLKIYRDSGFTYLSLRILDTLHKSYLKIIHPAKFKTLKAICGDSNIPYHEIDELGNGSLELIKELKPDLILSVFYPLMIEKKFLQIPKRGCLNIHRSPLPRYRGPCSAFWQLANNEKRTGVTLHKIDSGVDSGPILSQKLFEIKKSDTLHTICYKSAVHAKKLIHEALCNFENLDFIPQKDEDATKFSFPTREAMRIFLNTSRRFF